jgi:hypothetical protein
MNTLPGREAKWNNALFREFSGSRSQDGVGQDGGDFGGTLASRHAAGMC